MTSFKITPTTVPNLEGAVKLGSQTAVVVPSVLTGTAALTDSSGHSFTMNSTGAVAKYYDYGPLVYVSLDLEWIDQGSAVTTEEVRYTLPYACTGAAGVLSLGPVSTLSLEKLSLGTNVALGNSYGTLVENASGASNTLLVSDLSAAGSVSLAGFYSKGV